MSALAQVLESNDAVARTLALAGLRCVGPLLLERKDVLHAVLRCARTAEEERESAAAFALLDRVCAASPELAAGTFVIALRALALDEAAPTRVRERVGHEACAHPASIRLL